MANCYPLLPTALQEYEDLQKKNKTAAMEVSVNNYSVMTVGSWVQLLPSLI